MITAKRDWLHAAYQEGKPVGPLERGNARENGRRPFPVTPRLKR